MRGFKSMRTRLVTLFGGVTALLLVVMAIVMIVQVSTSQGQTIDGLAMEIVQARGAEIGRWLDGNRSEVRGLANLNVIREGDFEQTAEYLQGRHATKNPDHLQLYFADLNGDFITSDGARGNISHREYFDEIIRKGKAEVLTNTLSSAAGGDAIIAVVHEVRDFEGRLLGLMGATITLEMLSEVIEGMRFGKEGIGMIVDGTGLVAAHQDSELRMQLNLLEARDYPGLQGVGEQTVAGKAGIEEYRTPDGQKMHAIFAPVPNSPNWSVVYLIPDSDMTAAVVRLAWIISLLMLLTLAVIIVASVVIARIIARPVAFAADYAELVAQGDLTQELPPEYLARRDEIGMLASALQQMQDQLTDVVDNIKQTASYVGAGSREMSDAAQAISHGSEGLSSTAQALSQGASQQAASVEEVSASMEEMAANIQQSADNAMATEKIAVQSADEAQRSGSAVAETVVAMKQIAEKIAIIEDIARETNMLSLNAAIEAARAGEHGKGFAVVAAQVRKLAENSSKAAKEISDLSASSVRIAEEAGSIMDGLVPSIRKTAELVQEISASSREMSSGAGQVNAAVNQLDQVVQSTSASAEQVASTSEEQSSQTEQMAATAEQLSAQAHHLEEVIAYFRTIEAAAGLLDSPEVPTKRASSERLGKQSQSGAKKPPSKRPTGRTPVQSSGRAPSRQSGSAGRRTGITLASDAYQEAADGDFEEY